MHTGIDTWETVCAASGSQHVAAEAECRQKLADVRQQVKRMSYEWPIPRKAAAVWPSSTTLQGLLAACNVSG
jgi:hypothetical protein